MNAATLAGLTWYFHHEINAYQRNFIILAAILSFLMFRNVELPHSTLDLIADKLRRILSAWMITLTLLLLVWVMGEYEQNFSKYVILTWSVVAPLALVMSQILIQNLLQWFFKHHQRGEDSVVIVGITMVGLRFAGEIQNNPLMGKRFVGFFEDRDIERFPNVDKKFLLGRTDDLVEFVKKNHIGYIYVSLPITTQERIFNLLNSLADTTASVFFLPDVFIYDLVDARFDTINGLPVVAICETPFYGLNAIKKRLFDIIVSSLALLLLAPVMLIIALAIKLEDPSGPAIFRQRRYGYGGQEITVYKFRSMRVLEDGGVVRQATQDDPRVTRVGKFLRRSSLDEILQFINVLQGRMSVVGPRPHAVAHNEEFRKLIKGYMLRHKVQPGITGWAQVNGFRGEIRKSSDLEARTMFDLDYLRCWSLTFDLWILVRTVWIVLRGNMAY
ncbi:MAG: undecaprenyl-phosphate glucose phosphotransferase [Magnetococcales bacterium]|nr:undecaprenyl-phosphate glucose phosphotransferase [Magnetococcales bacterium]